MLRGDRAENALSGRERKAIPGGISLIR